VENEKQEKPASPEKPIRLGEFKNPVKEKKFEKYYVNYIEHPKDREFFIDCFEKRENEYILRGNLTKQEAKKLKEILKWVKKNHKGSIKIVPLLFAAAAAAAVVIFFTTFANPLLGRALEKGLEAVFEAKSDVRNFRLSLLKFRISIGSVTVANRDAPMKNLFELGRIELRMKPEAVLRGKVYIEEIRADDMRFGTERKVSGALPNRQLREKKQKEKSGNNAPPLIDLANFDAMALLNQEFDKLSTPKLYDEAIDVYNTTLVKWQGQVDSARTKVNELQTASQPLINMNANNMRDLDTIRKTVQDINNMITTVQSAADETRNMVRGIETDVNTARQLEQNARNAINDDINLLKSYIDLGSGAAFAALEPFIRDILDDSVEMYIDYGLRALEALEKIKELADTKLPANSKDAKQKKQRAVVFKGRDVAFPVTSYPSFYLGILASDFTLDGWNWSFDLRDVSSNPDLTGQPVTLALGAKETGGTLNRNAAFKGSADFRTNPAEKFSAFVNGGGFPVSLGDQMKAVGINGFSGAADFSLNLTGYNNGGVSAGGDVKINQARLIDPRGTIAEAAATAISEAGRIELGVQYIYNTDGKDEFSINTNIADLINRALRRTVEAYAQKAMAEIERVLREKISQYIDGKFVSKEQVDALLAMARGDMTAVEQMRTSLTNKRNEFEQRINAMANEAAQQARQEATRQADQAIQDIRQGQTPSLQVPNLPSTPSLPNNPFRR
jgi:uncharacterized protein (TIGR03545 family)